MNNSTLVLYKTIRDREEEEEERKKKRKKIEKGHILQFKLCDSTLVISGLCKTVSSNANSKTIPLIKPFCFFNKLLNCIE